jgi:hypothetical protein
MAYKVTGGCKHKSGAVSTAATMQAIQRATQSKADVINLSWGDFRGGGYADAKYSAILRAAMKSGALISVAAGNNGLMGPFFTEGGVTAQHSLSVASVSIFVNFTETLLRLDRPVLLEGKEVSLLGALVSVVPACVRACMGDSPCVLKTAACACITACKLFAGSLAQA